MSDPNLGDEVREVVTGYTGIVTGCCVYLWGDNQAQVTRADENGKPSSEWFDFGRLEVTKAGVLEPREHGKVPVRRAEHPPAGFVSGKR